MKVLAICLGLVLSMIPLAFPAAGQDGVKSCVSGDFDCVARALDERLRIVIDNAPMLMVPPPEFKPNATVVSIAAPGQTDEDVFPGDGCGPKMRLTVKGQAGAIGYMQCGTTVIQCMVARDATCTAKGEVEVKAAGKCGIAATGDGPATALCESAD